MKLKPFIAAACLTAMAMLAVTPLSAQNADYVFKNGAVYTMDGKNPKAEAIAITGKNISYVGDNDGAKALIGDKTQVIDLHGQMLLPGFVESHIHPGLSYCRPRSRFAIRVP